MKTMYRFISNEWDIRKMEKFAKENDPKSPRRLSRIAALKSLSDDLYAAVQEDFKQGEITVYYCKIFIRFSFWLSPDLIHWQATPSTTLILL